MSFNYDLMILLVQVGDGKISGHIDDWPQLRLACSYVVNKCIKLDLENEVLKTKKMYHPEDLLVFLESTGQGCISGNVLDWPQLKPACSWAVEEIIKLRRELKEARYES